LTEPESGPSASDPDTISDLFVSVPISSELTATIKLHESNIPDEPCNIVAIYGDFLPGGSYKTTYAIPLPDHHNLPPGFVFTTKWATVANFIATLSQWSGQPASDWEWFSNGYTKAWFTAAALYPEEIAVETFPLKPLAATLA
jgi:hypothetical protein